MLEGVYRALTQRYSMMAALTGSPARALLQQSDDAALITISRKVGVGDVEKHLDDYRKGKGQISSHTAENLRFLNAQNSSALADAPPQLASTYMAYGTALPYSKRSRYAFNMQEAVEGYGQITEAVG